MNDAEKIVMGILLVAAVNIVFFSQNSPQVIGAVFGQQGAAGLVGTLEKQGG